MSVVSGQITLSNTGPSSYYVGITSSDIDFYSGPRYNTTESVGYLNVGHADDGYQFAIAHKDSKSKTVQGRCIYGYNSAGTKVLEAEFTGSSAGYINFDVTSYDLNFPIQVVMRY